ncbi:chorismate mutase [Anaerolinea sp.]|uniref:chorismate mutase n=1 Tax=Anaerolinea sp. TaxID=1872519 RepID=UPI002ACDAD6B|nr:chorismate mutase [Anaerolinea sp.]
MSIRGIRGATTVDENTPEAILAGTRELLLALMQANPALKPEDIASIFFTMTEDLDAVHPALAARQLGWVVVPLMCAREISVPDSVQRCVRVLIHWNTDMPQNAVRHVYLRGAVTLRPEYAVDAQ